MQKVKIVISAGGRGTRLADNITGGFMPKGFWIYKGRSLIAYQLEQIKRAGFKEVFISVNEDWQILLFEQLIKQGRLPKLKYTLDKHPYGDPFNALITQKAVEYIGRSDFVWCGGEILYLGKLLNRMVKMANDYGGSVACVLKLCHPRPLAGKFIKWYANSIGKVISYQKSTKPNFVTSAPFYFQNDALGVIQQEFRKHNPRILRVTLNLVDQGKLFIITPEHMVHLDEPSDLGPMKKLINSLGK